MSEKRKGAPQKKESSELRNTFDAARRDIARFIVKDPQFLPAGSTDLGSILEAIELLPPEEFLERLKKVHISNGAQPTQVDADFDLLARHGLPTATTFPALVNGGKKEVIVNAKKITGNKTYMTQFLLEELAHAYCKETFVGNLDSLPIISSNYFPFANRNEITEYVRNRRTYHSGKSGIFLPQNIAVHRAGGLLYLQEDVIMEDGKNKTLTYGMPEDHASLEETRASILQSIFMAKVLGANSGKTPYDNVLTGFTRIHQAGLNSMTRGYYVQAAGYSLAAPTIAAMRGSNDSNIALSETLGFLHNCSFADLLSSQFGRSMGGQAINAAVSLFARQVV